MGVSAILIVASVFNLINYYFDLGYFGHSAKGIMMITFLIVLTYLAVLDPSKRDKEEHAPWRKKKTDT